MSAGSRAKARKAAAVVISKKVIGASPLAVSQASSSATDALVKAHQMRRGVDLDPLSRRLQHGAQEGERRALAVGAGDMDHRCQPLFRMAEGC
jgi:hypothetical protein